MEFLRLAGAGCDEERLALRFDVPPGGRASLAIVYLHGFGSTQSGEKATYFRAQALSAGWAFCSFDFRGHGASDGSMRELTFTRNLDDLHAVRSWLAEKGFGRIALFGSSMGGAVALWNAALQPAGVVAAALIAPAVGMAAGMERWAGPERFERWRRDGAMRYESELVRADLGWEMIDDLRRYDTGELARLYQTPSVIFQGQLDSSVDWRDVAGFADRTAPGVVELRLFADGNHRLTDRKTLLWDEAAAWFHRHLERPAVAKPEAPTG